MPRHNWRATPPGQRWCSDCKDFRPIDMFAELGNHDRDNYCSYHRAARRKASRRKYHPPQMIECPNCHLQFTKSD